MYLLDTNVVSELRKPRPHGAVVAWLESVDDAKLFLSAVTLGEIQAGVELTREQDDCGACPRQRLNRCDAQRRRFQGPWCGGIQPIWKRGRLNRGCN